MSRRDPGLYVYAPFVPVPFPASYDRPYPRAGVRVGPEGRFHLRLWIGPDLFDSTVIVSCSTLRDAVEYGELLANCKAIETGTDEYAD